MLCSFSLACKGFFGGFKFRVLAMRMAMRGRWHRRGYSSSTLEPPGQIMEQIWLPKVTHVRQPS